MRILLIEDSPGDARLIQELLARGDGGGYEVVCAQRLASGLARIEEEAFDVILVDLSLPDSWGLETLAAVKAKAPDVPVVVLTGFGDRMVALRAKQEGAQAYLVKDDVSGPLLERTIQGALEARVEQGQ
ncbi:MAG: response regulator [Armatimonadota bacterium]